MTQEELNEYNALSPNAKEYYNLGMRQHPEWTHQQALTFAIIGDIGGDVVPPKPPVDPKTLFERILVKAQEFIKTDFPRIYQQVRETFKKAIDWLTNAVNVTLNKILDFFR